ncbi:hypothetical protein, partial [Paraglaciecola arctica]|uniref:hypothetical protein n=1 Tax=Paraglaciecola arctica TaxID=1128911 RepID=UPI001C07127B
MKSLIVVAVTVFFILLSIQWPSLDDNPPELEVAFVDDLSLEVVPFIDDKSSEVLTIPSEDSVPQQVELAQISEAESIQDVGPTLDPDSFVESSSEGEPTNVGEFLDPDTHIAPSPNSEPRDVGEPLDPDKVFAEQQAYRESKNIGPILDVDEVYMVDDE